MDPIWAKRPLILPTRLKDKMFIHITWASFLADAFLNGTPNIIILFKYNESVQLIFFVSKFQSDKMFSQNFSQASVLNKFLFETILQSYLPFVVLKLIEIGVSN